MNGVETVNLSANNKAITFTASTLDDLTQVELTAAGAGSLQAATTGANQFPSPKLLFTGATALTVNGQATGNHRLAVLGNEAVDTVTSTANTVTRGTGTVTVGTNLARLEVRTFGGADTVNLAAFTSLPTLIDAGDGDDSATGSPQADLIEGGEGNDRLNGEAGIDTLRGGAGDDRLDGDGGNDQMFGGDGSDLFVWDPGDGSDLIEGDAGADALAFNGSADNEVFTLSEAGRRLELLRDVGAIDMDIAGVEQTEVNANDGNDRATVGDLRLTDVRLVILSGGNGDDALRGGRQGEVLRGDAGNDLLEGLEGNDTLDGGLGIDRIVGGRDSDTADYASAPAGVLADLVSRRVRIGAEREKLKQIENLAGSPFDDVFLGNDRGNRLDGRAGNDFLKGGAGKDTVDGGAGDDTVRGNKANDALFGGLGNDSMSGGSGNENLEGGDGNDTMSGGGGKDVLGSGTSRTSWKAAPSATSSTAATALTSCAATTATTPSSARWGQISWPAGRGTT